VASVAALRWGRPGDAAAHLHSSRRHHCLAVAVVVQREVSVGKATVRFYELLSKDEQQVPDIDIERLLDIVSNIPDQDAYVRLARMELLGSIHTPQGAGRAPQCPMITVDRITRDVRMRIEHGRRYRALELDEGDTIAEPTHVGLFERNVVGIMRQTGQSPGPASLRDFLNSAVFDEEMTIRPLVDSDALRALAGVGRLTRINLELDADTAAEVGGPANFLADAIRTFTQNLPGVSVELALKFSPNGPEDTSDRALGVVRQLFTRNALGSAQRANIRYRRIEDDRSDSFDFLAQAVAQEVEVEIDGDGGGPSSARASEAIREAYDKQYEDILSALDGTRTDSPSA
jgi:hypothetical protein